MEALSGLLGMMVGLAIFVLVLCVAIYIVQGIFLTKLNKLMYGKGSALAWIPIANAYLLGKLTINSVVGWILVIGTICTTTFTTTLNGVEKTVSILPASISTTVSNIISIAEFGLLIYAIIKYFKLKKEKAMPNNQSTQQETFVSPVEHNNVNVDSMSLEQNGVNQTVSEIPIMVEPTPVVQQPVQVETTTMVQQPIQEETNTAVQQPVVEAVENVAVQEVPVVSEPTVSAFNQQPVQAQTNMAVQQPVVEPVENVAVQEVPVVLEPTVSAFNQQPVQAQTNMAAQQPVVEPVENVTVQEVPVVSEPAVSAFNQQPIQAEPTSVTQQPTTSEPVALDSIPIETMSIQDTTVVNDSTTKPNNN